MTGPNDRVKALYWISTLTHKEFVDFFYEAVTERDMSQMPHEQVHLALAEVSTSPEEQEIAFLALPDPAKNPAPFSRDSSICQTGDCADCGALIRSIAKDALCPICNSKVRCT